jgi:hypothetical protein
MPWVLWHRRQRLRLRREGYRHPPIDLDCFHDSLQYLAEGGITIIRMSRRDMSESSVLPWDV